MSVFCKIYCNEILSKKFFDQENKGTFVVLSEVAMVIDSDPFTAFPGLLLMAGLTYRYILS